MTQTVTLPYVPYAVYPFLPATSEKLVPVGHRLVRVGWKETTKKDGTKVPGRSAVCTAVETVSVSVTPELLNTALNECVADMQDKIVSDYINAQIVNNSAVILTSLTIDPETVSLQGIADWSAVQAEKGRLSKESIGNWFDTMLLEPLSEALSSIPGITPEIITASLSTHRDNYQTLSNPRGAIPEITVKQLLQAIKLVPGDDKIKAGLTARLNVHLKPAIKTMQFALPVD